MASIHSNHNHEAQGTAANDGRDRYNSSPTMDSGVISLLSIERELLRWGMEEPWDPGFQQALQVDAHEVHNELLVNHQQAPPTLSGPDELATSLTSEQSAPTSDCNQPLSNAPTTDTAKDRLAPPTSHSEAPSLTMSDRVLATEHRCEPDSASLTSNSSNGAAESIAAREMESEEAILCRRLRQLESEVTPMRGKLRTLRDQSMYIASSRNGEGENVLKKLRPLLTESDINDGPVMLDQDLAFTIAKLLSGENNEVGSLWADMLELERNLDRTENEIRIAEMELHRLYTQAGPQISWSEMAAQDAADTWPPSTLPPKLVEYQKALNEVKLSYEALQALEWKYLVMDDKKKTREFARVYISPTKSLGLVLREEEEKALQDLSSKLPERKREYEDRSARLKILKQECLDAGIDATELKDFILIEDDEPEPEHEVLFDSDEEHDGPNAKIKPAAHLAVNSWLFTRLAFSHMEVRLLGTIVEFMRVPLLQETAQRVVDLWNSDVGQAQRCGKTASEIIDHQWESAEKFFEGEGYDKAVLEQMVKNDLVYDRVVKEQDVENASLSSMDTSAG